MNAVVEAGPLVRMLTFIRFSHTIFALPFALGAMLVAAGGFPRWQTVALILAAMVLARTAAMAFNRVVDWRIDQRNPRTAGRHRLLSLPAAITLCTMSALAFVGVTRFINPLCFRLAPVALGLIFFYSLTKRFTSWCHFFLGLALAASPVGAWLAVRGSLDFPPLVLAAGVLLWVAGFDVIYATQDVEFDRKEGLHSLVVRLGIPRSLQLAQWLHLGMFGFLALFGIVAGMGLPYLLGMLLIAATLAYEHFSARRLDLAAINHAFFTSNAVVGALFLLMTLIETVP